MKILEYQNNPLYTESVLDFQDFFFLVKLLTVFLMKFKLNLLSTFWLLVFLIFGVIPNKSLEKSRQEKSLKNGAYRGRIRQRKVKEDYDICNTISTEFTAIFLEMPAAFHNEFYFGNNPLLNSSSNAK